jgi:hypothetical protein
VPPRRQGRLAFAIVSVFALLAAGGFAVWSLTRPDGAADPEQAVRDLFTALDHGDAIGVMETLPPSERSIIRDAVLDSVSSLQRLGVLSDFDEHQVPGATFDVQNLQLSSSQLSPDVVAVSVTGGTLTTTTDPSSLPLGDLVRDKAKDELSKAKSQTTTEDLAKDHLRLAAVYEKGGWHVSLFYSIAEAARGRSTAPPLFGHGPTPLGADTPEDAVRQLVRAGTDLDPQLAIQTLPPDEMRVMYDYSSLFLPDAQKAAADAKKDGWHGRADRLDLRSEGDGDTRRVYVDGFDVTVGDSYEEVHATYDGSCYSLADNVLRQRSEYVDNQSESAQYCKDGTVKTNGTTNPRSSTSLAPFGSLASSSFQVAITVVQVDGGWYVSPTRTLVDSLLNGLHSISRDDLEKLLDGDIFSPSSGSFSTPGTFVPIGPAIPDDGSSPYEPGGTAPSARTTPGTGVRPTPTVPTNPVCHDVGGTIECSGSSVGGGYGSPPGTNAPARQRTTTTTTDDDSEQPGGPTGG